MQNVAPTLTVSGAASVNEGTPLVKSDPGADTINGWVIQWGDGTSSSVVGNLVSSKGAEIDLKNILIKQIQ